MSIDGTTGPDTLTGTLGDDVINAFGGNDTIFGSQGTDTINGGGGGSDRVFFNTFNSLLFAAATGSRTYLITGTSVTDSSGTINTTMTGVERVTLSTVGNGDFNDVIDASGWTSTNAFGLQIRIGNG